MDIKFSKMSGNGNDFIVIDNRDGKYTHLYKESPNFIEKVCARGLSVGADGMIFIEKSDTVDFKWQFFNSDGSVAEMCGNGARCAARFAYLEKIAGKEMAFETLAGIIKAEIACGKEYDIHSVNTGVPHAVIVCDNVDNIDVHNIGRDIRYNKDFAINGTNVNFIEVTGKDSLKIRTYERGVEGETLACGTGCAASALIALNKGLVKGPVKLLTKGGKTLTVYYDNETVYLQGEGRRVYTANLCEESYNY